MKNKHTSLCPNKKRRDRENGILDPVVKDKKKQTDETNKVRI